MHTPGHTEDHLVFWLREEDAVFSGDCILGEGRAVVFEDLADYLASLRRIASLNPKIIYPGHGPEIPDPGQRISEYIEHRLEREQQIVAVLGHSVQDSLSVMDIVQKVYTTTPVHLHMAAAGNVRHHLSKLIKDGAVATVEATEMRYYLKN